MITNGHESFLASMVRLYFPLPPFVNIRVHSWLKLFFRSPEFYLILRQSRDLYHRADFDRAKARAWDTPGDAYSLVEIFGVDQEVAAELFARLREGPVGHEPFAFSHPDAGRCRRRVQWAGGQIMSARVKFLRELCGLHIAILPLGFAQGLLVKINQQHIFHL